MRSAGVDLASQDKKTAICVIEWTKRAATVERLQVDVTDRQIVALVDEVDKIGIDVPLGWPVAFVDALTRHSPMGPWPLEYDHADNVRYRLRLTDRRVTEKLGGHPPLSVSADRIAIPAMRAAALLSRLSHEVARDGSGRVVEVYPAAALRVWGFDPRAYKTANNASTRALLVKELRVRTPWLAMTTDQSDLCEHDDDVLDALIAALIARAAATKLIEEPLPEDLATILREGWIALPRPGSLDELVTAASHGE